MNRIEVVMITILLVVISCSWMSEQTKENRGVKNEFPTVKKNVNTQDTLKSIGFFTDDDFVFGVINNDLPISYFKSMFQLIRIEVIHNQHSTLENDTIMIFSNGKDTANFYVSPTNTILLSVIINSQEIVLEDSIKVGMADNILKRKFDLEVIPDSLVVKDFENSSYFLIICREGQINKIIYKALYYD